MKKETLEAERDALKRVSIRLTEDLKRTRFDGLLEKEHYLCNSRTVGQKAIREKSNNETTHAMVCSIQACHPWHR